MSRVAEHLFGLLVKPDDATVSVGDQDRIGRRFEQVLRLGQRQLELGRLGHDRRFHHVEQLLEHRNARRQGLCLGHPRRGSRCLGGLENRAVCKGKQGNLHAKGQRPEKIDDGSRNRQPRKQNDGEQIAAGQQTAEPENRPNSMGDHEIPLRRNASTADGFSDVKHIKTRLAPVQVQRRRPLNHRARVQSQLLHQLHDHREMSQGFHAGQGNDLVPHRPGPVLPLREQAGCSQKREAAGLRFGSSGSHLRSYDRLQLTGQVLVRVGLEQPDEHARPLTAAGTAKPVVEPGDDPPGHLLHAAGIIAQPSSADPHSTMFRSDNRPRLNMSPAPSGRQYP